MTMLFTLLTCVYKLEVFFFPLISHLVRKAIAVTSVAGKKNGLTFLLTWSEHVRIWLKHTKPKWISRTRKEHYVLFSRAHFCSAWTMCITSALLFQPDLQHTCTLMSTSCAKQQIHNLSEIFIWYCIHYRATHNFIFEWFAVNNQSCHKCSPSLPMRPDKASVNFTSQGKASFYGPKLFASQTTHWTVSHFSEGNK